MKKISLAALAAGLALSGAASAQPGDTYVALSGAFSILNDSDNRGAFTAPFVTGAGTTIPAGVTLPAGTELGWTTDFSSGYAAQGAFGRRYGPFRAEFEVAFQRNSIDTHRDVVVGGLTVGNEDAGLLVTGSPNLGVTVANLVNDGEGSARTVFLMANALYDVDLGGPIKPYIGGGLGVGFVNVNYSPSGVEIINDGSTEFAWQAMGGVSWAVTPLTELFAGYRYRATGDASVEASLFAADFEVENKASIVEAGLRFSF